MNKQVVAIVAAIMWVAALFLFGSWVVTDAVPGPGDPVVQSDR